MRRLLIAFAPLLMVAGPAWSQDEAPETSAVFDVQGSVPAVCALNSPRLGSGEVAPNNIRTLSGLLLTIDELVDDTTLSSRAVDAEVVFPVVCTTPHRVTVSSERNGLWRGLSADLGRNDFADAVPYRIEIAWAGLEGELIAGAESRRRNDAFLDSGPAFGDMSLRLAVETGDTNVQSQTPLLAGEYGDVISVTLEPR